MDLVANETLAPRVIRFPKHKKRGRKVSKGPIADVLVFPASGEEDLVSEWAVMDRQARRPWKLVADADIQPKPLLGVELSIAMAYVKCVGEQVVRQEISEFRVRQAKVGKLINWLRAHGAQSEDLNYADAALLYLIDKNLIRMSTC